MCWKILKSMLCVMLILQIIQIPVLPDYWGKSDSNEGSLHAEDTANDVSFELYDKVYAGSKKGKFTVVDTRNNKIKVLDSKITQSGLSFDGAKSFIRERNTLSPLLDQSTAYGRFLKKNNNFFRCR